MTKILVVGGGLTAAVTSSLLKASPNSKNRVVKVWDKAKNVGGRMSTLKCRFNPALTADLGAQYITITPSSNRSYYDELIEQGVLVPLKHKILGQRPNKGGTEDFVTPRGSASLVSHYFSKSNTQVEFEHTVSSLRCDDDESKWQVETNESSSDQFDAVILTMPVPQILALIGDQLTPEVENNLRDVTYSSRYAMALFYDQPPDFVDLGPNACAKYFEGHEVFRYMSIDSVKRDSGGDITSVIFHTTVPFGIEHVERTNAEMGPILLSEISRMYPDWPQPKSSKCHKWRYSQASQTYKGEPGCVVIKENPLLIAGGDAFSGSVFDGCISSAEAISQAVEKHTKMSS